MTVNLSDVFTMEGKVERKEFIPELTAFESSLGTFEVDQKNPVLFTFTNMGTDKAKIEGELQMKFKAACDRCLTQVPVEIKSEVERFVVSPKIATDEDKEDSPFMDGYSLDLETLVYDEILENWPLKILCKEDCKGVCPVCGQNLNKKECGCDTFVPDPRMAAIKDIFLANKEV